MGFNRITWVPGHERSSIPAARLGPVERLREQRDNHARNIAASRALEGSLLSLAALLGSKVSAPDGRSVGRIRDVVVRWTTTGTYPAVTSVVVRMGKNDVMIGARWLDAAPPGTMRLRSSQAYAHAVGRRHADVALAHDILDRQLVDASGVQIVRPADLYLAAKGEGIELIGVEIGPQALIRRLGPRMLRGRIRPQRVIDWASISAFVPARTDGPERGGRHSEIAGSVGAGIELDVSAAEVKRLGPAEVQQALEHLCADEAGGSS